MIRHVEDGEMNEMAFSSLSIHSNDSSQAAGYKGKMPRKNKEEVFVKPNEKPNVKVKNNGSKEGCKICGNLHFSEC